MNVRIAVLLLTALLATAGCGGGAAQAKPRVTAAVVTDDRQSKTEKTVFAPDARTIYVLVNIADVPANTMMKSIWIAENAQGYQAHEKLDEATITVGGNLTSPVFNFTRNEPWPNGTYRVELYFGETLAHTARFRVEGVSANPKGMIPPVGPVPGAGPPARLGAILFARGQSGNAPVDPTTQFEEGVRAVYAFFNYADLEPNDTVTGIWKKDGTQVLEQKTTLAEIFSSGTPARRGHLWFAISFPNGASAGTLTIDLSINGTPAQSGSVTIGGSGAPASSPAASVTLGPIIFARGESNTQPVGRGDRFPQGINAVYAFFNYAGLTPEHTVTGIWHRDGEKILEQQAKMADLFKEAPRERGHLWFSITFEQGAAAGRYRLDLQVNGAPVTSGTFVVE